MDAAGGVGGNWYDLAVPLILLVIMISMGMELALSDFKRVLEVPRATAVGLVGQMLVLPAAGLAFAHWPGLSPEIAIGIVIITACPGGATSNVFSYLARANIALSITLTSLSSVLCFATIPLWINLGLSLFADATDPAGAALGLPVAATAVKLLVVTLLPVTIGMGIRAAWPAFSERVRTPLRRSMALLMALSVLIIVASEWQQVVGDLESAAGAALVLVSGMLGVAYALARIARLGERDAFTISIEVGLQNGALATLIVLSLLGRPELIVFPGAYAVLSFLPVSVWTLAMRRRVGGGAPPADAAERYASSSMP
jgi:BASS family bile acid:Na+ symporter